MAFEVISGCSKTIVDFFVAGASIMSSFTIISIRRGSSISGFARNISLDLVFNFFWI